MHFRTSIKSSTSSVISRRWVDSNFHTFSCNKNPSFIFTGSFNVASLYSSGVQWFLGYHERIQVAEYRHTGCHYKGQPSIQRTSRTDRRLQHFPTAGLQNRSAGQRAGICFPSLGQHAESDFDAYGDALSAPLYSKRRISAHCESTDSTG